MLGFRGGWCGVVWCGVVWCTLREDVSGQGKTLWRLSLARTRTSVSLEDVRQTLQKDTNTNKKKHAQEVKCVLGVFVWGDAGRCDGDVYS